MTIGQFFSILRARWWIAALVLAVTVILTVSVSLILPKKYTAAATVVVDAKPDPVSAMMYPGMTSPAFMATQVDIIQSDRVALRVVRLLRLSENQQLREEWLDATGGEGAFEPWLAELLQANLDVRPSRESNVITVSYRAPDPRFAAALANAFVQAYIDVTLELRVDPARQFSTFFDARAKDARERLEQAQSRLSAFQKEKGIIAADERLDVENARLNELSSQLVALQALSAESGSRQAQAAGAGAERLSDVINNPSVASLRAEVARLEAKLQELNARYGEAHPQVVELKANLAELRRKLENETRRVASSVGVNNTINKSRESQVRAELDAQRNKVLRMKAVRDEGSVLVRDVENAQRTYDTVLARLTQTSLESQTTQSNVNSLAQATPPAKPSSPRLLLNTLLAVFLGTLLAIGTTLFVEFVDRRVRSSDDVLAVLGLPVLGVLPGPQTKRLGGLARPSLMQQRVIGRLAAPGKGA